MGNKTKFLALCVGILILGLLSAPVFADQPHTINSPGFLAYPYPYPPPPYPPPVTELIMYLPVVMR